MVMLNSLEKSSLFEVRIKRIRFAEKSFVKRKFRLFSFQIDLTNVTIDIPARPPFPQP